MTLTPKAASAAACCGEAAGLGEQLLASENAAVAFRVGARGRVGSFDFEGDFVAAPEGSREGAVELNVAATARVTDHLELGAELPAQLNVRTATETEVGGGPGDVKAFARALLVSSHDHEYLPGVFVSVGASIPTGMPASRADTYVDITGQGNAELSLGLSLQKTFDDRVFARLSGAVGWFVPEVVDARSLARSPRLSVSALAGPVLDPVVLGAGVAYEAEAAPPSSPAGTTGRTRLDLVLALTADVSHRVALLASVKSPVPAADAGSNEIASVSGQLGVRMGFLD